AFDEALRIHGRPVMILARTLKGKGVSFVEDKEGWHGKALSKEQMKAALAELPLEGDEPPHAVQKPAGHAHAETSAAEREHMMSSPTYRLGQEVATRTAYGTALKKLGEIDSGV